LLRVSATTGEDGTLANAAGLLDPVIIDWEFAGWFPSYWECAIIMLAAGRFDDDWNY
jgi:hypothetical protein